MLESNNDEELRTERFLKSNWEKYVDRLSTGKRMQLRTAIDNLDAIDDKLEIDALKAQYDAVPDLYFRIKSNRPQVIVGGKRRKSHRRTSHRRKSHRRKSHRRKSHRRR